MNAVKDFGHKVLIQRSHGKSTSLSLFSYTAKGTRKMQDTYVEVWWDCVETFPLGDMNSEHEGFEPLWPAQRLQTFRNISLAACDGRLLKILPHLEFVSSKSFWALSWVEMKTKHPTAHWLPADKLPSRSHCQMLPTLLLLSAITCFYTISD